MLQAIQGRADRLRAVATHRVLTAQDDAQFSARAFLRRNAKKFSMTDAFRRSVVPRLAMLGHPDAVHLHAFRLEEVGVRLRDIVESVRKYRFAHATFVLELLSQEESDPNDVLSLTHPNYVRISANTCMLAKYEKDGTWLLDAGSGPCGSVQVARHRAQLRLAHAGLFL